MSFHEDITPSALEEGRGAATPETSSTIGGGKKLQYEDGTKHHHHHHHHGAHASRKIKSSLQHAREKKERRRRKEAERLQEKLPGLMKTDDHDVKKLRKRLIIKNEIIAAVAEFTGTFLFLFFSLGIATQAGQQQLSNSSSDQTKNSGGSLDTSQLLYASLGFGFSLAVNAWVFFRISGGLFNPAVTVGLFLCGALSWYRSVILFFTQFVAAIAAAGIAQVVIPGGINARTKLGNSTTLAQGFFIEMFCTAMLMFAIYMLAGEKHKATFLAPVGIGLALFLCELFAIGLTGGSLNPARTLGPDVIAASFETSTWIYYTAPFVGVFISAGIYWLLKASRYETANEGQDDDETEQALILRDNTGRITGAVQRVDASETKNMPGLNMDAINKSTVSLGSINPATGEKSRAPSITGTGPDGVGMTPVMAGGGQGDLSLPASPMPGSPLPRASGEIANNEAAQDKSLDETTSQLEQERKKDLTVGMATHDFSPSAPKLE